MTHASQPDSGPLSRTEYRVAIGVFVAILAGYLVTLAPTVTFWDAGEFLAASKILGIPHPPGTPFFVFLSHVWAQMIPFGEWAFRVNLLTAVSSAAAGALMFLVVFSALNEPDDQGEQDPWFAYGAGLAAAIVSAFAFTVWQNSNESEVYMVSGFLIAICCWLAWLWQRYRGTARAAHMLLLMVYLGALSIGNHLMTLLVGPALIAYVFHVMRSKPLEERESRIEHAQWLVLASIWFLLIGVGLGSTTLIILAGLMVMAAAAYALFMGGGIAFPAAVVVVAFVGVSTYLFLYIRAGLQPIINEADPSTWHSLLAVIRREQYPPRLPTDNPLYPSGAGNPGRTLGLIWLQIQNYLQYFDWQWANGLAPTKPIFDLSRLPFTLLFTTLGIVGAGTLWERNRSMFWLLIIMFLITGPGLVAYMNFKPGFSIGFELYPDGAQREVRERDYFFTISFQTWGILAGIGIAYLFKMLRGWLGGLRSGASSALKASPVFLVAFIPFALNYTAASRDYGPVPQLARDFAYDLLQSVEPYGILFTNGDNDTFPLWYIQEVEGVRQDVTVVNLSLGNTDWYIRQLRDNPVRPFDAEQAPWFANLAPATPPDSLHGLTDEQIRNMVPQRLPQALSFRAGDINHVLPQNTPLFVKDMLILRLIAENEQRPEGKRRPIYFSTTAGRDNWLGMDRYVVQEGLAMKLYTRGRPDSTRLGSGGLGVPLDIPRTDSLVWNVYRYAGLFEEDSLDLEPTDGNIATNLSLPYYSLYIAYQQHGDRERALENVAKAYHLWPTPQLRMAMEQLELSVPPAIGDTAVPSGNGVP